MAAPIKLIVHPSQFPAAVRGERIRSLRAREVNHKFHYESYKQAQKWLALHETFSPARTDPDCTRIYDEAFRAAASGCSSKSVHLVGLGCGGGQKEARLLDLLAQSGRQLGYTPVDVSAALVLVAASAARAVLEPTPGIVVDLALVSHLTELVDSQSEPGVARVFTFFGMIPNFEPEMILPKLAKLIRVGDTLLFSANLAPGNDYRAGVERIRPLYENELTNDWLMTLLLDLGIKATDGKLKWCIEGERFLRLAAYFRFNRQRTLSVHGEKLCFKQGEKVRLFFSYRYAPNTIAELLKSHGLKVQQQWVTKSEEEGVFLCGRA